VAAGDWTGYSRMHERYLYRQASYAEAEQGIRTAAAPETEKHGKTAQAGGGTETESLPLDI
jgi:hypothetical protein